MRELRNEIERAVALAREGESIRLEHLSPRLEAAGEGGGAAAWGVALSGAEGSSLLGARRAFEARYIGEVLRQEDGNVSHAAKRLRLSRVMLQRKMKAFGLR